MWPISYRPDNKMSSTTQGKLRTSEIAYAVGNPATVVTVSYMCESISVACASAAPEEATNNNEIWGTELQHAASCMAAKCVAFVHIVLR